MPRKIPSTSLLMGTLVLAVACDKDDDSGAGMTDDTGNLSGLYGECQEDVTVLLSPTDATPLGFTAQEVLANVIGEYPETLAWTAAEGPAYYAMPDTMVEMTLGIEYAAGETRYVEATPMGWCDGACGESCVSRIEIDGTLAFATADGVLDERWSAVFEATEPGLVSFYVPFDPDQTQGTMTLASFVLTEGTTFDTLLAIGSAGGGATTGSIGIQVELTGPGGGFGVGMIGNWPPLEGG